MSILNHKKSLKCVGNESYSVTICYVCLLGFWFTSVSLNPFYFMCLSINYRENCAISSLTNCTIKFILRQSLQRIFNNKYNTFLNIKVSKNYNKSHYIVHFIINIVLEQFNIQPIILVSI